MKCRHRAIQVQVNTCTNWSPMGYTYKQDINNYSREYQCADSADVLTLSNKLVCEEMYMYNKISNHNNSRQTQF